MNADEFFPKRTQTRPTIYAYSDPAYPDCLKVGFTGRDVVTRIEEQYPIILPGGKKPYRVELQEPAMYADGGSFTDKQVHSILRQMGVAHVGGEWFRCSVAEVKEAIVKVRNRLGVEVRRSADFAMRPEQEEAVARTMEYFRSANKEEGRSPQFLWNAKMRFGKTFASYQLAKRMGFRRVLVLTFKPATMNAWQEDLNSHVDFEGWQFICRPHELGEPNIDEQYEQADKRKPIVCFGSFQDFLGVNKETGGIKAKNTWVHEMPWDLVIFDEYHFGAWRDSAKSLFEMRDDDVPDEVPDNSVAEGQEYGGSSWLPLTADYYLYLSGTPFRALNDGEFIEEQIYGWTYSDEQRAKANWKGPQPNPYASLPRMVMLAYCMPESLRNIALKGENNEFDLNEFFRAEKKGDSAHFVYEDSVQKWLDMIRGGSLEISEGEWKLGSKDRPPMPFSHGPLLNLLSHTLWFLPDVASCLAMESLLKKRQNKFYHDYQVVVCAGNRAGNGADALPPVLEAMGGDPLISRTITLSCGKLTTGVTVKPWTGIFMLRNLSSPETYFQAAFRVQSPWEVSTQEGKKEIVKKECYVFDFALDRALKQIADYSYRLDTKESNPVNRVTELISFLPVLAYEEGAGMRQVNAEEILDTTMSGTSATLLAKRWESALLVNVDNETLARLLRNEKAMAALMRIEGFRRLNDDIQTIINKSEEVRKARNSKEHLTTKEKKELKEEEKEYMSKRKMIREKLIKFATRIPIFMYLTDDREHCLKDVIRQVEPDLFLKVTGLSVSDFDLLVGLNVFNESLMNDAVYKFKRYEDASLSYTGVDRHEEDDRVGLFSTSVSREDYERMAGVLQQTINSQRAEYPVGGTSVRWEDDEESDEDVSESSVSKRAVRPKKDSEKWIRSGRDKGDIVIHAVFGEGKVEKVQADRITVTFAVGKKQFQYPQVFERGLLKEQN